MIQEVLTPLFSEGGGASKVDPPLGKLQNLNSFGTQIPYVSFTNKYKMIQDDLTLQFSGRGGLLQPPSLWVNPSQLIKKNRPKTLSPQFSKNIFDQNIFNQKKF